MPGRRTQRSGRGPGKGGARGVALPSVSSCARPPPGTSCRKSLRRQKSRRGRVLLKHCSTAFRKHWEARETRPSLLQTTDLTPRRASVRSFPTSPRSAPGHPQPASFLIPVREEGQEAGSHRVPQVSQANVTRAQEQCVMSLEGQSGVSGFPPSTLTFQQHAAHRFPTPALHPQAPPSFPHRVLGAPLPHWP